jgi:hypothetical protein
MNDPEYHSGSKAVLLLLSFLISCHSSVRLSDGRNDENISTLVRCSSLILVKRYFEHKPMRTKQVFCIVNYLQIILSIHHLKTFILISGVTMLGTIIFTSESVTRRYPDNCRPDLGCSTGRDNRKRSNSQVACETHLQQD